MLGKKNVWAFVLVMVLMFQLIIPVGIMSSYAKTGHDMTGDITITPGAILVSSGGVEITPDALGVYNNVPKDASIEMGYKFSVPDSLGVDATGDAIDYDLVKDDFFLVDLPTDISFNVSDSSIIVSGVSIAVVSINSTSSQAIVTFTTDRAFSQIEGWFHLKGSFSEEIKNDTTIATINLSFNATGTLIVGKIEKDGVDIEITKTGIYNSTTESIDWTIKLRPEKDVSGVVLTDTFSNNQTYVDGSFAVNGVTTTLGLTLGPGNKFKYEFPTTISAATVQSITYQTIPSPGAFTSLSSITFDNTANVSSGSIGKSSNAKVKLDWIEKSGSPDNVNKVINWTVTVNKSGQNISGASIWDALPLGTVLSPGSVTIEKNGINSSVVSGSALGQYKYNETTNILSYEFEGLLTGPAMLKYQTIVIDPNAYNSNDKTNFINEASFNWTGNTLGTPSDKARVGVGSSVLTKRANPNTIQYLYQVTDEIDWKLVVNTSKITITGASISDAIPTGLEYVEGSFKIVNSSNTSVTTGDFSTGPGMIYYDFGLGSVINDTYTISYKTKVVDHSVFYTNGKVTNTNFATLSGLGIKNGVQTTKRTQTYESQVLAKSATNYNYDTRIMKWEMVVNRNELPLTNLVVSDLLPLGLEFLPGTFEIEASSGASVVATPAGVLTFTTSGAVNVVSPEGFTYTFPTGVYSDKYTITFDTKVKAPMLNDQGWVDFVNQANITSLDLNLTVSAIKSIKNPIVGKEAIYTPGADYVTWSIPINSNKITLSNIVIKDKLQTGLELDLNSIKLYKMTVDPITGNLSKGATPVAIHPSFYTVSYSGISGTNEFDFGIPDTINEAFQLEFITDILVPTLNIVNNITFNGSGIVATPGAVTFRAAISESTAGGSGTLGEITIHKVNNDGVSLAGVVFELTDNKGVVVETATTDANGSVTFDKLLYKTYFVREKTPLSGYLANDHIEKFRLNSTKHVFDYTFVNHKALGDIEFYKFAEGNMPLEGAFFTLYNTSGDAVSDARSDSAGLVKFTKVPVGDYNIKETTPPPGYYKTDIVIKASVTIGATNTAIVTTSAVSIINSKIPRRPPGTPPPPGEPPINIDEDLPAGGDVVAPDSSLPKTGGINNTYLYFMGGLLILLGLILRRRTA